MGNIGDLQSLCDVLTIFPANPAQGPPWSSYRLTVAPPATTDTTNNTKNVALFEQLRLR